MGGLTYRLNPFKGGLTKLQIVIFTIQSFFFIFGLVIYNSSAKKKKGKKEIKYGSEDFEF